MANEEIDPMDLSSFDRVLDDCNAFIERLSQGTFSSMFISESTLNRMPDSLRDGAMRFRTWRLQRFRLQNREATISLLNALVDLEKVLRAELRQVVTHKATLRDLCGNTYIALTELMSLRAKQMELLDARTESVRVVVNSATEGLSSLKCMMTFLAETFRLRDIENSNKPGQAGVKPSKKGGKNNAQNQQLYLAAIKDDDVGAELYQRQIRMKKLRDRSMKYLESLLEKREAVSVERDHCLRIIEGLAAVGSMDKEKMALKYAHADHSEFMRLTNQDGSGNGIMDLLSIRTLSKLPDDASHGKHKLSLAELESTLSGRAKSENDDATSTLNGQSSSSPAKPSYDTLSATDIVNYEKANEAKNSVTTSQDFHEAIANLQSSVRPAGIRHRLSSLFVASHAADEMVLDDRRLAVANATTASSSSSSSSSSSGTTGLSLLSKPKRRAVYSDGVIRVDAMFKEFSEVYQLIENTDQSKLFTAQLSLRLEQMVQARERLREQAELIKVDVDQVTGQLHQNEDNTSNNEDDGNSRERRPSVFGFLRKVMTFASSDSPSSSSTPPSDQGVSLSNKNDTLSSPSSAASPSEGSNNARPISIATRDAFSSDPNASSPNSFAQDASDAQDFDYDGTGDVRVVSMQASRIMDALKGEVERVRTSSKRISLVDDPALKDLLMVIQSTPQPNYAFDASMLRDVEEVAETTGSNDDDDDVNNVFSSHEDDGVEEDEIQLELVMAGRLTGETMAFLNTRPPSPPAQSRSSTTA